MQKLTTSKQRELLNTQNNVEETPNKNSTLIVREQVENTPFWIINNEQGWFLTFGEYRLGQIQATKNEAIAALETNKWEIIMHMAAVIVEKTLKGLPEQIEE